MKKIPIVLVVTAILSVAMFKKYYMREEMIGMVVAAICFTGNVFFLGVAWGQSRMKNSGQKPSDK